MKRYVGFFLTVLLPAALFADAALRSGDTVEIRLGGVPQDEILQVSGSYTIDGEGNLNLPHIGKVRGGSMTTTQVQNAIESSYKSKQIYTNPTISITMQAGTAASRFVNVSGEVKQPQRVQYTVDLTLLSAITAAGGFSDYADAKKVQLLRGSERRVVDVRQIRNDPSKDITLLPGDQILVPQSWF